MNYLAPCALSFLVGFIAALLTVFYIGRVEGRRDEARRSAELARRLRQAQERRGEKVAQETDQKALLAQKALAKMYEEM